MNKEVVSFIKETVSIVVIAFVLAMILRVFASKAESSHLDLCCLPYSCRTGLWSINSSIILKSPSAEI